MARSPGIQGMSATSSALDMRIREAALEWCAVLRRRWGDAVPASELRSFPFEHGRLSLYGQQGIFKPKELGDGPLSIRTAIGSPYADEPIEGGRFIRYDFRADRESENEGLKRLRDLMAPLIYLVQVKERPDPEYMVVSPVFITGWDDSRRTFLVDYQPAVEGGIAEDSFIPDPERRYAIQIVRARLHQAHFRKAVLTAYSNRCAACELRIRPLLDGAHIVGDRLQGGDPIVQNGISFCVMHHRAFDRKILRVDADFRIQVDQSRVPAQDEEARRTLLDRQGQSLILPKDQRLWPDRERLQRAAAG